ncbi:MAG: 16S rRNA (cytosine(1402)-N(4))-methyltransferase RsmH [Spirochaetales bacterium]|nr:16S rRNA (cytosine(1402)-N(4))-methyltransferase RsmH [Spirochaetales bacterium]
MNYVHTSIMPEELLSHLVPQSPDPIMVDATCGEGGHTHLFLSAYPDLTVVGVDRDREIQKKARVRMEAFGNRFKPVSMWFDAFFKEAEDDSFDLILFDLGISMFHFDESHRGFSLRKGEPLDMRLDSEDPISAFDVVNRYDEKKLADVIYAYGEERYSRRIARAIVQQRKTKTIATTDDLAGIVYKNVPPAYRYQKIHPATRTFQAIRIEVNRELDRIEPALTEAIRTLKVGGRLAVITFHSLEDRPVKWLFRNLAQEERPVLKILTKKPLVPSEEEVARNSASRSSKLRIVEKIREEERHGT